MRCESGVKTYCWYIHTIMRKVPGLAAIFTLKTIKSLLNLLHSSKQTIQTLRGTGWNCWHNNPAKVTAALSWLQRALLSKYSQMPHFNSLNEFPHWVWNGSMLQLSVLKKTRCCTTRTSEAHHDNRRWQKETRKTQRCTVDISVYLSEEEGSLKTSLIGRSHMINSLDLCCPIRSYFYTSGVNVVKEEHPVLDRSMTLPFLIRLREVTDKNRLLWYLGRKGGEGWDMRSIKWGRKREIMNRAVSKPHQYHPSIQTNVLLVESIKQQGTSVSVTCLLERC